MDVIPSSLFPKAPVRSDDLIFILDQIAYGHHCALLGASNSGKSALLNSLTTPAINQALAARLLLPPADDKTNSPQEPTSDSQISALKQPTLVVFVDCLEAGDSEHALYEVIMRRIVEEFTDHGLPDIGQDTAHGQAADRNRIGHNPAADPRISQAWSGTGSQQSFISLGLAELSDIHLSVLNAANELAFRSAFASGLRRLLQSADCGLLLILDEFDDAFRNLPPWPFRQLRAAANQHEDQIQYMVATSHQLGNLRKDDQTYEFRELFQMTTRSLMPLDDDDAQRLLQYLDAHEPEPPNAELRPSIITASGGHPGLLERIHGLLSQRAIDADAAQSTDALIAVLLKQEPILKECQRLWQELEEPEQLALRQWLQSGPSNSSPQILMVKGLLSTASEQLFSPLFERFLQAELPASPRPPVSADGDLRLDADTDQIWAGSEEITWTLASEHQRALVRLLIRNAGGVTTFDEIASQVYGVGEGVSPGAIRELVNRTRKKLPDPDTIVNVPGEGYRLK